MADNYLSGQKAAKIKRLDTTTEEVCQWLTRMLDFEITDKNYMEKLKSGVELCRLQNKLCGLLGGEKIKYHVDAEKHPQFARQNIEHFVKWCKDLRCRTLFEPNDLVNENKQQADERMKISCKNVISCLDQLKDKYDSTITDKREDGASEEEENKKVTATMADETDSNTAVITTQAQEKDPNQSEATQTSGLAPKPRDGKVEERETSVIQGTALEESQSPTTTSGSNEPLRVKDDITLKAAVTDHVAPSDTKDGLKGAATAQVEVAPKDTKDGAKAEATAPPTTSGSNESDMKDGESTRKAAATARVAPSDPNTPNGPLMIRGYFYPVIFLCILPLVFLGGFYYFKRRK